MYGYYWILPEKRFHCIIVLRKFGQIYILLRAFNILIYLYRFLRKAIYYIAFPHISWPYIFFLTSISRNLASEKHNWTYYVNSDIWNDGRRWGMKNEPYLFFWIWHQFSLSKPQSHLFLPSFQAAIIYFVFQA